MNSLDAISASIRIGRENLQALILAELDEAALCALIREEIRAAQELGRQDPIIPSRPSATGRGAGDLLAG
jgi:hypothetical protein